MIAQIDEDFKKLWDALSNSEKKMNQNLIRKFKKVQRKLLAMKYSASQQKNQNGVNA